MHSSILNQVNRRQNRQLSAFRQHNNNNIYKSTNNKDNNNPTVNLTNPTFQHKPIKKSIKLIHWNCNHISNKIAFITNLIDKYNPDIISLNEIKCNKITANHYLNFENYTSVHKIRNEYGGGVCLLVKNNIKFDILDLNTKDEIVGCKLRLENNHYLNIYSWYNPSGSQLNQETLNSISKNNFI
jgi:hypothetical protein